MIKEDGQHKPMIRSLVAYCDQETQAITLRRNLELQNLEQAIADQSKAWIDIVDPSSVELDWLAKHFNLTLAIIDDLRRVDRRPALLVYQSYLFLSLFEPQIKLGQVTGHEIHCIMTDTCFITVRQEGAVALEEAYERVAQNPDAWSYGIAYFMYLAAQHIIDTYYPLIDRISNQLNDQEEKLLHGVGDSNIDTQTRKMVYRVKQQLINLRQMIAPQREVISNMIGEKRVAENSDIRDLFRHLYERLLRVYDVIDSQRDLSSNVLDMMQNQESRKMSEAVNRLTIFSMVFLPLTFFSSLFQLNFVTAAEPVVLPVPGNLLLGIVLMSMILSAVVMTVAFRKRGWL